MGKILRLFGAFFCFVSITFFSGCDDSECSESVTTTMLVNFYDKTNLAQHTDTLAVFGLQNDSLLSDTAIIRTLQLPLRIIEGSTSFVFDFVHPNNLMFVSDTIEFIHTNNVHFISEACGCSMFFTLDSVIYTRNRIDSIAINSNEITNELTENIQVFFDLVENEN